VCARCGRGWTLRAGSTVAAAVQQAGERRGRTRRHDADGRGGEGASAHPVQRGARRILVRGRATLKCVEPTTRETSALEDASSNALTAGCTPNRNRIHAACRASTEWIA